MIGFYFNGTQLPVNPEKITIKRQGNNKRTEVVLLGEVNILRLGKLASITFDFLLPGYDGYEVNITDSQSIKRMLLSECSQFKLG